MTKKQLADVYRRAAEICAKLYTASCFAIEGSGGGDFAYGHCACLYRSVMGVSLVDNNWHDTDRQQVRVLMLLLMAEWVMTDWDGGIPE